MATLLKVGCEKYKSKRKRKSFFLSLSQHEIIKQINKKKKLHGGKEKDDRKKNLHILTGKKTKHIKTIS